MKKNIFIYIYFFTALLVVLVNSFFLIKDNFFINIENVPNGVYEYSEFSPDGKIELRVYNVDLTIGNCVRISETKNNNTRNIFWQTGADRVTIKWKNKNDVVINGIELDLNNGEFFDCRSISSIFNDGYMGR